MARIAERDAAESKSLKRRQDLVKRSSDLWIAGAESVARANIIEGKSLKKAVASVAKAKALEHGILAVSEGIKAAIAFASFDFTRGAAHLTNAAVSAAFALSAAAVAGVAGGFSGSGGGRAVAGAGPAAFGAGGPAPGGDTGSTGSGDLGGEVPVSPESDPIDTTGQAASQSNGTKVNVQIQNNITTLGTPDDETMMKLDKANKRSGDRLGRLSARAS